MDLQTLKFKVETGELVSAVTAIKNLGTEVSKLNKPVKENTKETENSTKATKENVSVLQRQQDILKFMADGYSKGQASVLAYAKAAGALTTEIADLGVVLQKQRTLMGTDPFDKSLGALTALKNEYTIIKEVQRLYNAELGLSRSQMEQLARDKIRLLEQYKIEGKSLSDIKSGIMSLNMAYLSNVDAENKIINSMKAKEQQVAATSKANAYLEKEIYRVNTALQEQNKDLSSGTTNALIRFETALKNSGKTAQEQSVALDNYRQKLLSLQKASGNRQVDYLARALGPQITDIGVGLMTGQNPMTVLLQQGGQLRDQLALAGVAGKDMGKALQDAAAGMVGSIKDVGVAVGSLVVNSFANAGQAVLKFGGNVTGVTPLMEKLRYQVALMDMSSGGSGLTKAFNFASKALEVFTGGLVLGAAALGIAFLMSLKEVTRQEGELTKALTLSGGALGMTSDQALALAKTYAGARGNIGAFTEAITASAKAGSISADNLEAVTTAAVALNRSAGIPLEDTVKQFSKLGEKPTEAIRELAKTTGLLSPEILKSVDALEKQGKTSEATALSTKAYSEALKIAASDIEKNMGSLESLFHAIGSGASWMWDKISNIGRKDDLDTQLKNAEEKLKRLNVLTFGVLNKQAITDQTKVVFGLMQEIETQKQLGDEKAKNKAYAEWEVKYGKYAEQALSKQALFEAKKLKLQEESIAAGATQAQQAVALAGLRREIFGEAAQPNNLEIAQKAYGEELKMAQTMNENKRKVLKFYYDIGLKDRSEYVAEDTKLLEGSETEQLAVIEKFQKQFADAYEIQRAALTAKSGAGSQDVKNLKDKFDELNKSLENTKRTLADAIDTRSMENMKAIGEVIRQAKDAYVELGKTIDTSQNQRAASYAAEKELAGAYGASAERIKAYRDEYNKLIPAITAAEERVKQAEKNLAEAPAGTEQANLAITALYQTRAYLAKTTSDSQIAAAKAASDAELRYNDMSLKRLNAYNDAFAKVFEGMADAIVTFAQTGKLSFSGLIDSMLVDLIRFELRAQMSALYSATGGAKGLMSMFTGGGGGATGQFEADINTSGFTANALGGAYGPSGIQAFAKGGSFTNSVVDSPTLFKFAKGTGMMGEAGPEAIMPLRRGPDGSLGVQAQGGGGSNVSVNVINNSSSQATTSETTDSRGNRQIEVVIGDMTASEVQRSGSASQKAMKSTFGVQQQLIRR